MKYLITLTTILFAFNNSVNAQEIISASCKFDDGKLQESLAKSCTNFQTFISESQVSIVEVDGSLVIMGDVYGLGENPMHGFHIHQFGDLSDGCASCGGHFNPFEVNIQLMISNALNNISNE